MARTKQPFRLDRPITFGAEDGGRWLFERVVVSGVLLALIGLAAYVFLAALGLVDTRLVTPWGATVAETLHLDSDPSGLQRIAVGGGALLAGLILVGIVLQRWFGGGGRSRPSQSASHVLSADERGVVMIDSRGLCNVAAAAVQHVHGVVDVKVKVVGRGASPVRLELEVFASAAAEQTKVGDEVRQKAADAVEKLAGIDVQQVMVQMRAVPLEELGRNLE